MRGMLLYSILLLVGFLILFKSADQFVIGSVATAKNLDISPMVIGLTVVALGTSAPEIFVAIAASLKGEAELAIGNA
ncbi:MAG TPA: calcium/sodium antiporter, partial [Pseudomonadales bacterium]|nr:calcium/sodium antiporter [Pseudomonadales bacterium]